MPAASHLILPLASPDELAAELGHLFMATRTIRGMEAGDLAKASGVSVQEIELIESGQGGQLATFLRVAQTLNFVEALMDACQPPPETLDELQRMEDLLAVAARSRRARPRGEPSP